MQNSHFGDATDKGYMSKRNKGNNNKQKTTSTATATKNIDEKVFACEIIKAYEEYERGKIIEKEREDKKRQEEWLRILNQKQYPLNEKGILRKYHKVRNDFFLFKNLLFIKAKDVRDMRATFGLMQLAVIGIFSLCKWILYLCAANMIYGVWSGTIEIAIGCMLAVILWVFARIFRIASFEMEKIDKENLIIAIFSGVLSFVAVVIAIVTIIVDKV